MLSKAGSPFQSIKADTINGISQDPDLLMLVKTYNNTKVRAGERVVNPKMHVQGLFHWIHERFQKDIDAKKTEKGKQAGEEKRKKIMAYFANHDQDQIAKVFELSNLIADIKAPIIAKMNQAGRAALSRAIVYIANGRCNSSGASSSAGGSPATNSRAEW